MSTGELQTQNVFTHSTRPSPGALQFQPSALCTRESVSVPPRRLLGAHLTRELWLVSVRVWMLELLMWLYVLLPLLSARAGSAEQLVSRGRRELRGRLAWPCLVAIHRGGTVQARPTVLGMCAV